MSETKPQLGLIYMGLTKDGLEVPLWYPRAEKNNKAIVVSLYDVRAADDIRISYDFARDGWVIEQATRDTWDVSDDVCDRAWKEAAFCPAWQFLPKDEE